MPTKGYIYLIRNLLNGKAYIGKTEKAASLKGRKRPAFSDEWKARISAGKNRQYAQMRKEAQFAHIN
jgi:hypothetical protein